MNDISSRILTVDSPDLMGPRELNQFIKDGFAYVKFPDLSIIPLLENLRKESILFFNLPPEEKEKDGILFNPKTIEGYVNRRKERSYKPILQEQIFFRPNKPIGPFKQMQPEINAIQDVFWDKIAKVIIKLILEYLLFPLDYDAEHIEKEYSHIRKNIFNSLSLLYYPFARNPDDYQCGINEHTDQSFLTVLWVTQECLQVCLENKQGKAKWYDLEPKPGYAVVNIGNALSAITGGKCRSSIHRVLTPKEERLSIAAFYDPSINYIMRNILDNTLIFGGSSKAFLKDHFSTTYSPIFEETLDIAHPGVHSE
jgi:isopenicillin N synthase-like dioxygenase